MLDKDRVTELVMQSGLHEFGYGHDRERFVTALAYFATALQHEALKSAKREDAEPVAFIGTDGSLGWLKKPEALYSKPLPLFMQSAPDVDAEPVAYETDQELWAADDPDINDWIKQNGRPLYTHPAPAVVAQLVEAAKRAMNYAENVVMAEGVYFDHDDDLPFIESALAAAKETGI